MGILLPVWFKTAHLLHNGQRPCLEWVRASQDYRLISGGFHTFLEYGFRVFTAMRRLVQSDLNL